MSNFNIDTGGTDSPYQPHAGDPAAGAHGIAETDDVIITDLEATEAGVIDLAGRVLAKAWSAALAVKHAQLIRGSNGTVAQCTTAGTTAASEPAWPTGLGSTVTDGTAVWTVLVPSGAYVATGQTQAAGPAQVTPWEVTAANAEAGQWSLALAGSMFSGFSDSVMLLGYNTQNSAGFSATMPQLFLQWESDYFVGGAHKMEFHLDFSPIAQGSTTVAAASNGQSMPQSTINVASTAGFPIFGRVSIAGISGGVSYTGITGTTLTGCTGGTGTLATGAAVASAPYQQRPIMMQLDRNTGAMNQFTLSATNLSMTDWATQVEYASFSISGINAFAAPGYDGTVAIGNGASGTPPSGQHAHLYLYDGARSGGPTWQLDTLNSTVASISMDAVALFYFFNSRGVAVNVEDNSAAFTVQANATGPVVQIRAGSTAGDLLRWQNSSSVNIAKVDQNGGIHPGNSAAVGGAIWSGSGAPNIAASVAGDIYFRTDTPSTANQRIYIATAANTWTGIL